MPNTEAVVSAKVKTNVKEPPLYQVIYINDNTTSMEFVVGSLIEFFDYSFETAEQLALHVHENGAATVAVLPYEIAEQKGVEVTISARANNYPLQIKLEPEN